MPNDLKGYQDELYKRNILSLLGAIRELRPLPPHLDYMVSVKGRLSATPTVFLGVTPNREGALTIDALSYVEITLPVQMDIPDGIRWLEDQVRDKGLDIREQLTAEEMQIPQPTIQAQENPGH